MSGISSHSHHVSLRTGTDWSATARRRRRRRPLFQSVRQLVDARELDAGDRTLRAQRTNPRLRARSKERDVVSDSRSNLRRSLLSTNRFVHRRGQEGDSPSIRLFHGKILSAGARRACNGAARAIVGEHGHFAARSAIFSLARREFGLGIGARDASDDASRIAAPEKLSSRKETCNC